MSISTFETIVYTFIFLVPGFIMHEIISSLLPGKKEGEGNRFLRYLAYSIFNLTIWVWLFWIIIMFINHNTFWYWFTLSVSILVTSIISGILVGMIRKINLIGKVVKKLKIQIVHPVPTAWEYKFSNQKDSCWLIVALNEGKYYRGLFSCNSLASSNMEYKDIYIEEVYVLDDDNCNWLRVERTDGVWISAEQIKYIEFLK